MHAVVDFLPFVQAEEAAIIRVSDVVSLGVSGSHTSVTRMAPGENIVVTVIISTGVLAISMGQPVDLCSVARHIVQILLMRFPILHQKG